MTDSADILASLPAEHREEFKEPLGTLHTDDDALFTRIDGPMITVGDVVSYHAEQAGYTPDVSIVDGRTQREAVDPSIEAVLEATDASQLSAINPPGTLTVSLIERVRIAIDQDGPVQLSVDGEEDLAVLPAIMLAPEGTHVLYGQPDEGMVEVVVDPDAREDARTLISLFEGDLEHVWALLDR